MLYAAIEVYQMRFHRVLTFIDRNLHDDLNAARLAAVAGFSVAHFQRQFAAYFGITVQNYVQAKRMKRAAYRLAFRPEFGLVEIALDSCFESPEAFSRAFKRRIGQAPSDFRKAPKWGPWLEVSQPLANLEEAFMLENLSDDDVEIINVPETPVVVMEQKGDAKLIGNTIARFIAWRKANHLPPSRSQTFNLLYHDPEDVPPEAYRFGLACTYSQPLKLEGEDLRFDAIKGGLCAWVRHVGANDAIKSKVLWLFREWLPSSGYDLRDVPMFLQRIMFFPDVPDHEAVTDIFLPLEPGQ
jgi:AraC family transcriptional regulator